MLKVECESCKAPYQIDERRVPPAGLKMRCPKCGHSFLVTNPNALAALRAPLFEDKVVDFLVELAEVTEKPVSRDELFKEDEE